MSLLWMMDRCVNGGNHHHTIQSENLKAILFGWSAGLLSNFVHEKKLTLSAITKSNVVFSVVEWKISI